jgi:hypothetical protein
MVRLKVTAARNVDSKGGLRAWEQRLGWVDRSLCHENRVVHWLGRLTRGTVQPTANLPGA